MSVRRIVRTFQEWSQRGEPLVLATVYDTIGSTYSKAGHRILIAANGDYQGLVSGGCLEGDLAERARRVADQREAVAVSYDLRDEADDLWGLGVGCNGLIRVFLQPLLPERGFEPFAAIARCLMGTDCAAVATVIQTGRSPLVAGGTLIRVKGESEQWDLASTDTDRLERGCEEVLQSGAARYLVDESGIGVLYAMLRPVPRLLVLGAGLDAVPLVSMAAEIGWLVTVADHRPAYIDRGGFQDAERVMTIDPRTLGSEIDLEIFDCVIVMSHHLLTDQAYLAQLAEIDAGYIGVLGPPARKARLLADLGSVGEALRPKLKGPVGLDIGADSPESIALSILAELQATLSSAKTC